MTKPHPQSSLSDTSPGFRISDKTKWTVNTATIAAVIAAAFYVGGWVKEVNKNGPNYEALATEVHQMHDELKDIRTDLRLVKAAVCYTAPTPKAGESPRRVAVDDTH
jgi:hypothetical protein